MTTRRNPEDKGPLPRSREAVDWWLKKWGRQAVLDGKEPLNRADVERLIEVNDGMAEGLNLVERDMRDANLSELELQGADFEWADLQGTLLIGTKLQGAYLAGAKLQGSQLFEAKLQGAYFTGANLQGANLGVADLQGALMHCADLQGTRLVQAKLQGAYLGEAKLQGANLSMVYISHDTNLEDVKWDKNYISVLERQGDYEAAIALYRRLKEWYRGAGMLKIAGEFHYREEEAITKARGQQIWSGFKEIRDDLREFKRGLKVAWKLLRGNDSDTQLRE